MPDFQFSRGQVVAKWQRYGHANFEIKDYSYPNTVKTTYICSPIEEIQLTIAQMAPKVKRVVRFRQ
jgi:hypothetical protein